MSWWWIDFTVSQDGEWRFVTGLPCIISCLLFMICWLRSFLVPVECIFFWVGRYLKPTGSASWRCWCSICSALDTPDRFYSLTYRMITDCFKALNLYLPALWVTPFQQFLFVTFSEKCITPFLFSHLNVSISKIHVTYLFFCMIYFQIFCYEHFAKL